jgi:hypothetical protein
LPRFKFESETFQWVLPTIFVSCGESCLIVSWCVGCRCGMAGSDEDRGRSKRPSVKTRDGRHRSSTRWSDDQEAG